MKRVACLALSLSFCSFSALAQSPVPLVADRALEVDRVAPMSVGIEVADTKAADISTLTLFTPRDGADAWLTKAWGGIYNQGKVSLSDVVPEEPFFALSSKSVPVVLYDLLVAGGGKPAQLPANADWLMQRAVALEKLGFLHSAYDMLDAVPRSQMTNAMRKKKMLYAASLNKWDIACEILGGFPQDNSQLLSIFCDAKTKGFDKAALRLSVLEEQGKPPALWFIQLLEAMRYGTKMQDLPPYQDPLTWAMVLSVGEALLPKDTLNETWFETATTAQMLQLWYSKKESSALEPLLQKHLNHFSFGHFAPNSYKDERAGLLDHAYKRSKADDVIGSAADAGENDRPLWDEIARLVRKLESGRSVGSLPDPKKMLEMKGGYADAWAAVMRAYVLLDALDFAVKPEYWQTLGEFAEGKSLSLPHRYVAPNMVPFVDAMGDPAHRTDLILTAVGLLGTQDALREQPDILQASLVRALMNAGLNELAFDLAAESIQSMVPRD